MVWLPAQKLSLLTNFSNVQAVAFLDEDKKAYFFVQGPTDNLPVQVGQAFDSPTISAQKGIQLKIDWT